MAKFYVLVELEVEDDVDLTQGEVQQHVGTAVKRWGGGYAPDHPLFPPNIISVKTSQPKRID